MKKLLLILLCLPFLFSSCGEKKKRITEEESLQKIIELQTKQQDNWNKQLKKYEEDYTRRMKENEDELDKALRNYNSFK